MNQTISKSKMSRLCLMFFILLCSVFKSENTFARDHWVKDYMVVTYDKKDKSITFDILCYDYCFAHLEKHGYLHTLNIEYSEDGKTYTGLMKLETYYQKCKDWTTIKLKEKKIGEKIQILNFYKSDNEIIWPDNGKDLKVKVNVSEKLYKRSFHWVRSKRSYIGLKWYLPYSCNLVGSFTAKGLWVISDGSGFDKINEVYKLDHVKSISNRLENAPSEFNSVIIDKVKISDETAAINVSGAKPDENIKVYTISGLEVKSVVANDDVVNIKLPTNQIYIVKAGQARYTVVL